MVDPVCLRFWEELIGLLSEISETDGHLLATIGPVTISLPFEMREQLDPLKGRRIAVLRMESGHRVRDLEA